jgi:acetylornithine deacetylase/succinyl-diaminopimelate desuccinylase-like protein
MNLNKHNHFTLRITQVFTQLLTECASILAQIMDKAGINSKIIYLEESKDNEKNSPPPIVVGEVKSKSNPNGKTILFYNHYDVQPEDPVDQWKHDPFSGMVEDNRIYGRGSTDDKGELITRIKAVEIFLRETGDVPCNIKFIVEGEEEIGSEHIQEYLSKYKHILNCDLVIWEDGEIDEKDIPVILLGMKGILSIELECRGPSREMHSGLDAIVKNPAWQIIKCLNSLVNDNGIILIKDWYKDIKGFTDEENVAIDNQTFDEEAFKKEYQINDFINNMAGFELKKALVGSPTCNICGLVCGYGGEGAKMVLPSKSVAKLDFRLVSNMDPEIQLKRLRYHLVNNGFSKDIVLRVLGKEPPARISIKTHLSNLLKTLREKFMEIQ